MEAYDAFETNIGYGKAPTSTATASPAPQPQGDVKTPSAPTAPKSQSAPQPQPIQTVPATPTQTVQPPISNPAASPKPTWQPTEQDKIRMAYNTGNVIREFNKQSRGRVEQTRRMAERTTQRGRDLVKGATLRAQTAGTPAKVMGMTSDVTASPSWNSQGVAGEQAKPLLSGQGPVPYGVVEVDGQRKIQWLLPDGSLTTLHGGRQS